MSNTTQYFQIKMYAVAQRAKAEGNAQLEQYFSDALKDIYRAEKSLFKVLPILQKAATTPELKSVIGEHNIQTEEHISRLEQVFEIIGRNVQEKKCAAIVGLIEESQCIIEETEEGSLTRDIAIIMVTQKIEHYEIATYGALSSLALAIGYPEVAEILDQTLVEEKQTGYYLAEIAENNINWETERELY